MHDSTVAAVLANDRRAPQDALRRLRKLVRTAQSLASPSAAECISTGCAALDGALPARGLARGSLVEWLADGPGCGATTLAIVAAREAQRRGGAVVVVDDQRGFYPVAAAAWGLDLASLILVRPADDRAAAWALDQALRWPHVAAAIAWPRKLDSRVFRRLQLAAEASGAVGLLVRPASVRRQPSWADVRLLIRPRPSPARAALSSSPGGAWRLSVQLLRCRGRFGSGEQVLEVEIDDRTGELHEPRAGHLAAELADPATDRQQA